MPAQTGSYGVRLLEIEELAMTTFGRATKLGCVMAVLAAWAVGPSLVQAADDMDKVELKLPKPAFIGTPKNPPPRTGG